MENRSTIINLLRNIKQNATMENKLNKDECQALREYLRRKPTSLKNLYDELGRFFKNEITEKPVRIYKVEIAGIHNKKSRKKYRKTPRYQQMPLVEPNNYRSKHMSF
jgi:hypothetical protein